MIFKSKSCGFADKIDITNGTYSSISLNGDDDWVIYHVGDRMGNREILTWDDLGRWASDMKAIYKYDIYDSDYHIYSGDNMEFMKKSVVEYKRRWKENPFPVMFALHNRGYKKIPDDFFDEL